jgi:hypothetical protein
MYTEWGLHVGMTSTERQLCTCSTWLLTVALQGTHLKLWLLHTGCILRHHLAPV